MKGASILLSAISILLVTPAKHINKNNKKIAVKGYDVVSYFNNSPKKGSSKFSFVYQEAIYHFSSAENQKKFAVSPQKYAPAYGGWCAYAMVEKAEKVDVNPKTYKIINGQLLLFYNQFGLNTLKLWNKWEDEQQQIVKANTNWATIIK